MSDEQPVDPVPAVETVVAPVVEKVGIQEVKEALVGVQDLSLVLVKHVKDGLQIGKDAAGISRRKIGRNAAHGRQGQNRSG